MSTPRSNRCVAKEWRNVCSVTGFLMPAAADRLLEETRVLARCQMLTVATAGKQITLRWRRIGVIAALAFPPPLAKQIKHIIGQHDVPILAALGLDDADDLLRRCRCRRP